MYKGKLHYFTKEREKCDVSFRTRRRKIHFTFDTILEKRKCLRLFDYLLL